jgi:hypothetical protein
MSGITTYLEEVRAHLHLDSDTERRVIGELRAHFDEKLADLQRGGMAREAAEREAIASCGEPRVIARLTYEACSRGSWIDTLVGCQPHLVVAALFATHQWRHPFLLFAAFVPITVITFIAWRRNSADWRYPWTGYAFLPLLIAAYFSVEPVVGTVSFLLTGQGSPAPALLLAGLAGFLAFSAWLLAAATIRAVRRDWILVSLMLSPLPVVLVWLLSVSPQGQADLLAALAQGLEGGSSRFDGAMALFCITLGLSTALFMRLRQRYLKAAAIFAAGVVGSAIAVSALQGGLDAFRILAVSVCMVAFLVLPFALHALVGRDGKPKQA